MESQLAMVAQGFSKEVYEDVLYIDVKLELVHALLIKHIEINVKHVV